MESRLNKLKSTVTEVTADVTSAVMGNPVTREFDGGRHIASGGNGLAWKIFNGVQHLTRLQHPRLLTVQHPLEEFRDCLAFCTEPVFCQFSQYIKDYKLYDVETKCGLLQVSKGLVFLHSSVKMVHGNITPENTILNKSGAWKIMGFDFCVSSTNPSEQEPKFPCKGWDSDLPSLCLPNPEYLAPEYTLYVSCETASDMYSLGTVMYAIFNKRKRIFEVNKQDIYKSFSRQLDQLNYLGSSSLTNIPEEVREHVRLLLNVTPTVRPDADQMIRFLSLMMLVQ
uniref:Protein kinase domain-containing protein n=1 Tax=Nomascus leucogenys TaxID=61853 RepID=A0A2I3H9E0_NOMLE